MADTADKAAKDKANIEDHLRWHLTDGNWHDRCSYCLHRRRPGGTGVTDAQRAAALEGINE